MKPGSKEQATMVESKQGGSPERHDTASLPPLPTVSFKPPHSAHPPNTDDPISRDQLKANSWLSALLPLADVHADRL